MDSLTHFLAVLLTAGGSVSGPSLFALGLGAILPDIDILFKPLSDRYPEFYLFTHGGITHSIPGALSMTPLALIGIALASAGGIFPSPGDGLAWGLMAVLFVVGTFTHLFLDALACPGIPLFYPLSLHKYTAAIFPGPSIVLFGASLLYVSITVAGYSVQAGTSCYAAFVILFISTRGIISVIVQGRTPGRAIPTLNPLNWLILSEDNEQYRLWSFHLFSGRGPVTVFPKYTNITPGEIGTLVRLPEYRRLGFYSYAITAKRNGDQIAFSDPLRCERFLFYPPYYTNLVLPAPDGTPAPG